MRLLAVALMAAALCVCVEAQGSSLLQLVAANPRLKTLSGLLQQPVYARIAQVLSARGDRTFLAPTDDAFAAVPNFDPANVRVVSATLLYHILSPRLNTAAMKSRGHAFVPTLMNDAALVNLGAGKSQVVQVQARGDALALIFGMPHNSTWEAAIVQPDIAANNGVLHVIDKVLGIPRGATEAARLGGLDALIANLRQAGLLDIAENTPGLTIFAPTNEAFDAFQRLRAANPSLDQSAIMRQHLLPQLMYSPQLKDGSTLQTLAPGKTVHIARSGADMTVNGVPVRTSDVLLKNGVVHIITKVLGTD